MTLSLGFCLTFIYVIEYNIKYFMSVHIAVDCFDIKKDIMTQENSFDKIASYVFIIDITFKILQLN
jgi:hypothetical protein